MFDYLFIPHTATIYTPMHPFHQCFLSYSSGKAKPSGTFEESLVGEVRFKKEKIPTQRSIPMTWTVTRTAAQQNLQVELLRR